ncbi:MAG: pirin family protein [Chitinophagales bacterium]|nr:pirin family protein [Chitinophagales bacterium]MDW8417929.1 pirin family protein [Chitinophagales bacterium]
MNSTSQTLKAVERVLSPPAPHWVGDGFRVHNFFPGGYSLGLRRFSPFFLMDYNAKVEFPPSDRQRGVGVHPHRGFETVTLAYHGAVAHHDSAGNSGIIYPGDVQWMTAGSGVLHKEYHEKEFSRKGGVFQMVQLWVNLPARYKMTAPKYQSIRAEQMGKVAVPGGGGYVDVIAGELRGVKGPAFTFTPINVFNFYLKAGDRFAFDLPERDNTCILVLDGEAYIQDRQVMQDHLVIFAHTGTQVQIYATQDATLLALSGEPIDEPIAAYGPFLMNTHEEIIQAYEDLNQGKFGYLEE